MNDDIAWVLVVEKRGQLYCLDFDARLTKEIIKGGFPNSVQVQTSEPLVPAWSWHNYYRKSCFIITVVGLKAIFLSGKRISRFGYSPTRKNLLRQLSLSVYPFLSSSPLFLKS